MTKIIALAMLVSAAAILWMLGDALTSDAVAWGLGSLFGFMLGLPANLLLLVYITSRRRQTNLPSARKFKVEVLDMRSNV